MSGEPSKGSMERVNAMERKAGQYLPSDFWRAWIAAEFDAAIREARLEEAKQLSEGDKAMIESCACILRKEGKPLHAKELERIVVALSTPQPPASKEQPK